MDAHILKKTQSIVEGLTENYAIMQTQYSAAYLAWCGNPCSIDVEMAWQSERKKILEKDTILRELVKKTNKYKTTTKNWIMKCCDNPVVKLSIDDLKNLGIDIDNLESKEISTKGCQPDKVIDEELDSILRLASEFTYRK